MNKIKLIAILFLTALICGCTTSPMPSSAGVDAPVEHFTAKDAEHVGDDDCDCEAHKLTKKQADQLGVKGSCEGCAPQK